MKDNLWVCVTDNEYGLSIQGVYEDEGDMYASLAKSVREWWSEITDQEDVPSKPPEDDRECVDLYYKVKREMDPMENYAVDIVPLQRKGVVNV